MRDITSYWLAVCEATELKGVRVHDLLHTFASHAAMNKETLPMIGRLLGHIYLGSTARYAHHDDEQVLETAEQIGAAIERMMDVPIRVA